MKGGDFVLILMVTTCWFVVETLICNDCVGQDEKSCLSTMIQTNCSDENATACTTMTGVQRILTNQKHVRDLSSPAITNEYRKSCTYLRGIDCQHYCGMLEAIQFTGCKMLKCCFEDFCN